MEKVTEKVNELENLEANTVEQIFTDIVKSGNMQLIQVKEHIIECVAEMDRRIQHGKSLTILQKNVLLNLLNQKENLERRLDEVEKQCKEIQAYRLTELYNQILQNYEKSEE